jgi:hypothetical protein
MQTVRVIVCERTGKWASALRVLVPLPRTAICETRGLAECRVRLRESPASLIVVESTPENWLDVCRWLPLQTGQFANMRAVIVAEPVLRGAECLLRTAGAHHLVDSLAGLGGLSRWIVRHIDQTPRSKQSVRQWTWSRMPWPPRKTDPDRK